MKKVISLLLVGLMTVGMMGCAKSDDSSVPSDPSGSDVPELLYVPEYFETGDDAESIYRNGAVISGEELCYPVSVPGGDESAGSVIVRCVSLTEGTIADIPLAFDASRICGWTLGDDGCLYVVQYVWDYEGITDLSGMGRMLLKYDRSGNQVFSQDISEFFAGQEAFSVGFAVDGKGRVCLFQDDAIRLFDENGIPEGNINLSSDAGSEINGFCRGSDGKVYAVIADNSSTDNGATLYQINYETKKLDAGQEGFSKFTRYMLGQDALDSLLINDGMSVLRCHLKSGDKEEILRWADCGIDGTLVSAVSMLSDGRIAAFYRDWQDENAGVALLSGISRAEAPQKQEIVIAQIYPNQDLPAAVTLFNFQSDKYHVTVNNYLKDHYASQEEVEAAVTRLVADIVSGNGPDIINPLGLDNEIEELVAMGAFEDLNPYLDQSSVLDREDMIESVLRAQTYDSVLISIPASFDVYTYFGSRDKVGEEMGWTHEDVIALLEANPGAALDDGITKATLLFWCMDFNDYVDWETASCRFDSEEFKSLLEFVSRLSAPEENAFNSGGWPLVMEKLRSGEILLLFSGISRFTDIQVVQEKMQGDVTAIGWPTSDGSAECHLLVQNTAAMLSQSKVKDGAWEFIEYYLTEGNDRYRYGFPNSWSKLEDMIAEETKCAVYTSGEFEGEPVLDENGDPVPAMRTGYDFGGYRFETRLPTQEEIDQVLDIIRAGKSTNVSVDETMLRQIISEEADAFFQGQKSVDKVADIIQRRASVYVSENS